MTCFCLTSQQVSCFGKSQDRFADVWQVARQDWMGTTKITEGYHYEHFKKRFTRNR